MKDRAMGFVHPEYVVDTAWLAAHLDDPSVVVLDVTTHLVPAAGVGTRPVSGRPDFELGHIPGAQFVDLQGDLSDPGHRFRFMLPSAAQFAAVMGRLGVGDGTRVVLYSTDNLWWSSRVWWMLRVFGHDNAAVLDGGWHKWAAEGRPAATGAGSVRAPAQFTARAARPLMADRDEVLAAIGDLGVCTINALREDQHRGAGGVQYGRPGRIAGSVNVAAARLVGPVSKTLLPAAVLRALFAEVGALDRRVITYCGGGIAASADALVLTMLGHTDVKIYDASLIEWVSDASLPMEVG